MDDSSIDRPSAAKTKKPRRKRSPQGKRCGVYGCSNTNKDGVGLHIFPNQEDFPKRHAAWSRVVRHTRANFRWESDTVSFVCSDNFADDAVNRMKKRLMSEVHPERKVNWRLKPDAVPSISLLPAACPVHGTPNIFSLPPGPVPVTPNSASNSGRKQICSTPRPKRTVAARRERRKVSPALFCAFHSSLSSLTHKHG
jgi:hypothetical protein